MKPQRHRWGEPDRLDPHVTLRICLKCGMRKLTHHANDNRSWTTFASSEGIAYHGTSTPKCLPAENPDV